jgi:hypothetical protein
MIPSFLQLLLLVVGAGAQQIQVQILLEVMEALVEAVLILLAEGLFLVRLVGLVIPHPLLHHKEATAAQEVPAVQTSALEAVVAQPQLAQMEQAPLVETGALVQHQPFQAPL